MVICNQGFFLLSHITVVQKDEDAIVVVSSVPLHGEVEIPVPMDIFDAD